MAESILGTGILESTSPIILEQKQYPISYSDDSIRIRERVQSYILKVPIVPGTILLRFSVNGSFIFSWTSTQFQTSLTFYLEWTYNEQGGIQQNIDSKDNINTSSASSILIGSGYSSGLLNFENYTSIDISYSIYNPDSGFDLTNFNIVGRINVDMIYGKFPS